MKLIVLALLIASFALSVFSLRYVRDARAERVEAQAALDVMQSKFAQVEIRDKRMRSLVSGEPTVAPTKVAALLAVTDVFNRYDATEAIRITGVRSSRGQLGGDGVALTQLFAPTDTSGLVVAPIEYSFVLTSFDRFVGLVRDLDNLSVAFGNIRVDQDNGANTIVNMTLGIVAKAEQATQVVPLGNQPILPGVVGYPESPDVKAAAPQRPRLSVGK